MNLFIPMFLAGLAISYHCVSMCGMMVLSYAIKDETGGPFSKRMLPHLAYQSARALSYVTVGLALGAIGSAFNIAGIRPYIMIFAGVYMVLMGLNMTGKFPALRRISPRPPKFMMTLLQKLRRKAKAEEEAGESSLATPLMFGAVTGLMPCGPLQSAQIAAIGAGTPIAGAVAMLGFWAGTMPLMLGFGAASSMLTTRFKRYAMVAGAAAIIVVGLVTLNRGAMLAGSPITFQTVKSYALGAPPASASQQFATGKDGVVEVKLAIQKTKFVPDTVSIPADKPVRLIVDRQEENACSAQLAVPQLGILQNLKPNATTIVDIPASKGGAYTLTCGMGMMSGRLQVGAPGGTSPSRLPLLALLFAGAAAVVWARRRAVVLTPAPARGGSSAGNRGRSTPHSHGGRAGTKGGDRRPAPAYAGFSPEEVLVVAGGLAAAVITGLYFGGLFS